MRLPARPAGAAVVRTAAAASRDGLRDRHGDAAGSAEAHRRPRGLLPRVRPRHHGAAVGAGVGDHARGSGRASRPGAAAGGVTGVKGP
ncbi:hypothetical protein BN2537_14451 [Streptomyces venezuelae]|nr:hypothetical protein BN2537_14451 [Streptomyces venezuelae]